MTGSDGCFTITVLLDDGMEALHRVTSVLAHQRASVSSLHLTASPTFPGVRDVTIDFHANINGARQLVERLRRLVPVHEARITHGPR